MNKETNKDTPAKKSLGNIMISKILKRNVVRLVYIVKSVSRERGMDRGRREGRRMGREREKESESCYGRFGKGNVCE